MDIQPLILAYAAAVVVALAVTASFSSSIEQVLFRLLPEEVAPHWARFIKFAAFVAAVGGGLPAPLAGFVDRAASAPPPSGPSEGLMLVMNSASGALMASSWFLLVFFGVTLTALTAGRAYAALRKYREMEEREAAQRGEPVKRKEPAEPRPVQKEKAPPDASPRR